MSRIGKKPVAIPGTVKVSIAGLKVMAEGPKGKLEFVMPAGFKAEVKDQAITVTRPSDAKADLAFHGLARSYINNIIKGVSEGYVKTLEIQGVGFRAQLQGKVLV
ncbi:MAG: 50S ribosomal protein L6, partial [Candidatus Omnitrophota bacterium]